MSSIFLTASFRNVKKRKFVIEDLWNAIVIRDSKLAIEIVESLQVNLDERDIEDCHSSALHMAAETGQDEIVQALIKYGAPVDSNNKLNDTPLMLAAANGHI